MRGTCGGAVLAKREPTITFEHVREALRRAGVDEEMAIKVLGELLTVRHEGKNVGGRPLDDDEQRIAHTRALMRAGIKRWPAAGIATADLSEPAKTTARKRINRKAKPQE